jgi:aminoglycoside phosphotransferase (APT) family kinase protein
MAGQPTEKRRLTWFELPDRVREEIEARLQGRVIEAISQPGGFSPGMASRLRLADGRRVFVKAVGPELNPDSPGIFRHEAEIAAAIPAFAPVPRFLWSHDEGEQGWVALAFEDIDGHPPANPWRPDELDRVVNALIELSVDLTPSPIEVEPASETFSRMLNGWQLLLAGAPEELDAWSRRHLEALAQLEARAPDATAGDTLIHLDIRSDNLLLTQERVVVVDWPGAAIGAPWVDLVCMAPSVTLEGGPEPEELIVRHPAVRAADPDTVDAVIAALAGYFTQRSHLPPPPGLPTLRAFQAAQGEIARRWLARRTGWL